MNKLLFLLSLVFAFSCATTPTQIKEDPQGFRGKQISLAGEVQTSLTIPGTEITAFFLSDGEEGIVVLGKEIVSSGQSVTLTGEVIVLADENAGDGAESAVNQVVSVLEENNLLQGAFVEFAAQALINTIQSLASFRSKVYFFVQS